MIKLICFEYGNRKITLKGKYFHANRLAYCCIFVRRKKTIKIRHNKITFLLLIILLVRELKQE